MELLGVDVSVGLSAPGDSFCELIAVIDDDQFEPGTEYFSVTMMIAEDFVTLAPSTTTIIIIDNDSMLPNNCMPSIQNTAVTRESLCED